MDVGMTTAAGLALGVATAAAISDSRRGEIPNWLTLPPIVLGPFAYGAVFGIEYAAHSLGAACLSALIPYLLFRRGGMGGGDVKLFGALGALTGFDLMVGLEIQLAAFIIAMGLSFASLAWQGALLRTLANAVVQGLNPVLPKKHRRRASQALSAPIRMGAPILVATGIFSTPHLLRAWSEL